MGGRWRSLVSHCWSDRLQKSMWGSLGWSTRYWSRAGNGAKSCLATVDGDRYIQRCEQVCGYMGFSINLSLSSLSGKGLEVMLQQQQAFLVPDLGFIFICNSLRYNSNTYNYPYKVIFTWFYCGTTNTIIIFRIFSSPPPKTLYPLAVIPHISVTFPSLDHHQYTLTLNFPNLDISYKWNIAMHGSCFTWHSIFKFHACSIVYS